jgi:hypothetical protein
MFVAKSQQENRSLWLTLKKISDVPVGNPKSNEAEAWLFYHLKNVYDLTLAAREPVSRLIRSELRSAA